ncbi:MAG: asparaginase domain-containing protein [Gemmatimonadota bacterium]
MRVKIFTTGGSMDKGYSTRESAFLVMEPQVTGILRAANATIQYELESLFRKDSLDITDGDRDLIFRKVKGDPCTHVLITHGTDTMATTGRVLSKIQGKTIVLTGAMQPAAFKDSDAPFNVGFALAALQTLPHGVYLAMNGRIFDPHHVRKNAERDQFEAEE